MGFGIGIVLLVAGLIVVTGAVDLPSGVDDVVSTDAMGWILTLVGIFAIFLAVVMSLRSHTTYIEERVER